MSQSKKDLPPVCVVRPCDWEEDGHIELAEWGRKVAAAKDAAMEKYGSPMLLPNELPALPTGYFVNDHDNYYLHQAIMAAWKYWGKRA